MSDKADWIRCKVAEVLPLSKFKHAEFDMARWRLEEFLTEAWNKGVAEERAKAPKSPPPAFKYDIDDED